MVINVKMNHYSDTELLEFFKEGSKEAFSCFYERHQSSLHTFISFQIFSSSTINADDIFQQCWKIFINYTLSKKIVYPKTYLFTIALNLIKSNGQKVQETITEYDIECHEEPSHESMEGFLENLEENKFVRKHLSNALKLLSQEKMNLFSVVYLRFFEELKFKEIAIIESVSEATVKSRYKYGLKFLRKNMNERNS